ncbi:MAG: acetyl-CoA C-acyltransferase [Pirellulaceae bacterium]|nr:acetyl-CoA C-acyltransferase [Pirellulaceae bacterium]
MSSYILAARRTPLGKFLGSLAGTPAPQLAAAAIRAALADAAIDPAAVDEVILGNVVSAGIGQAPARQAALAAGIPAAVPALTINKVCGSGLKAVMLADQAIRAGDARIVVAGGMENMSRAPHLLAGVRTGWRYGSQTAVDALQHDGLHCSLSGEGMGTLADRTAEKHGISREDQDAFALASQQRAAQAIAAGDFRREIVPMEVAAGKQSLLVEQDEGPRADATLAALAKLRPAFSPTGTATAGNASQISDGAAALVVADEATAQKCETPLKARIVATATAAAQPADLFVAPVAAIERVLAKANLAINQIDLVELNEAFAVQCLACMRPLGLDQAKVNVRGGAIAQGHPIGASGARILTTLLHTLNDRQARYGLAALCLGGGEAVAMIVEHELST